MEKSKVQYELVRPTGTGMPKMTTSRLQRLSLTFVCGIALVCFSVVVYGPTKWNQSVGLRWDTESMARQSPPPLNWKQNLLLEASPRGTPESSAKKFLTIGISTVYREAEYLKATLQSLLDQSWPEERELVTVVIFLADTDEERRDLQQKLVENSFGSQLTSGFIRIIHAPPSIYPPFDFALGKRTYDDSVDRVIWRTKQVIDFAFLFSYVRLHDISEYYVVAEDDIVASNQYITAITDFIRLKRRDGSKWSALQFTTFVGIGLLFQTKDLEKLAEFLIMFHKEQPVDLLMKKFTEIETPGTANGGVLHRKPSLFQHIGEKSTLVNKVQNLIDDSFGEGNRLFENVKNPPALYVSSTLNILEDFVPENAYSPAPGWFQGASEIGRTHDTFDVIYEAPISVERIVILTGLPYGLGKIEDGATLVVGSHSETGGSEGKSKGVVCAELNTVGVFANGSTDVVFNKTMKIQCIQVQLPAQLSVIINEIKVFQEN